jgi:signal transduction histidine kinase
MFPVRLHTKFLILVLGGLILFLSLLAYALVRREAGLLHRKAEDKQQMLALTIYSDMKESMMEGLPRSTLHLMDSLRGTYGLVRLETLRRDGSPAFGVRSPRFDIPHLDRVFETGLEFSFRDTSDALVHTILYPLRNEQDCRGCHKHDQHILGVLLISLSLEDSVREIESSTLRLSFFLAALILAIGGGLYYLVRAVILRPLAMLHEGAEHIGRGELSHRISLSTNDEMQDLANAFNAMADRLEGSYAELEQRIRERTSEVEDKAKRLYEYSRGMATISRLSTRVFNAEQPLDQMLDRFMWAITRGLGYRRSLLCLVDRKQAWLEVKRDSGLGAMLGIANQPLAGPDRFAEAVRSGRELFVHDAATDPVFSGYPRNGRETLSLYLVPILSGTRDRQCWQAKNCIRTDCPAYRQEARKCWLLENTFCGSELIESYGDKLVYCMTCKVFPVLGVLVAALPGGRAFHRRDMSVLRILAADMGAALENHRLHADNRQLVKELLELHKVTATVLAEPSLDRALEAFTDSALKFSGLDACNFWLASGNGQELIHKAGGCAGPVRQDAFCPERLPADKGALGRAFQENRIITEYHTEKDETVLGRAAAENGLRSLLAVPLRTERRTMGVFSIHKKSSTPFFETEIAAFMLLANHAAMAINVCVLSEELKNQNRELADNISLMSGILGSMSSGVILVAPDGAIMLINRAGAELLQVRPDQIVHRRLAELFPDSGIFTKPSAGHYQEEEIVRLDGTIIPLGFSVAPYSSSASGESEGSIIVFRDLTEIKALQAKVVSKERFSAMGQVVAGVAHEIRNPLFGISAIGQIFERELASPAHQKLTKALLSETKRLNKLVEELLIYGRPMNLSFTWCDLTALWKNVISIYREELARKDIILKGDFGIGHIKAYLDAQQIQQVFLNLLGNSIDALPGGGEITIRLLLEDRYIIFKVIDTGAGMPADHLSKVFDLFYSTKPKGTGLGLPICKKIVEDHGGVISLVSRQEEGSDAAKGTTVTVKLPYRGMMDSTESPLPQKK